MRKINAYQLSLRARRSPTSAVKYLKIMGMPHATVTEEKLRLARLHKMDRFVRRDLAWAHFEMLVIRRALDVCQGLIDRYQAEIELLESDRARAESSGDINLALDCTVRIAERKSRINGIVAAWMSASTPLGRSAA